MTTKTTATQTLIVLAGCAARLAAAHRAAGRNAAAQAYADRARALLDEVGQ